MSKRVCLLTGASGAFGTAFIRRYAQSYKIIAVHHLRQVCFPSQDQHFVDPLFPSRTIAANEHAIHSIRADLSRADAIERLAHEIIEAGNTVDLLVNAAAARSFSPLLAPGALDTVRTVFGVNVIAPLQLCLALARTMWQHNPDANARNNRNIVNVSSTAGLAVYQDQGCAVYAASMAALNHLTYHLASEFWDIGLRVNAVALDAWSNETLLEKATETVVDLDASARTGEVVPFYGPAIQPPDQPSSQRSAEAR